MPKFTLDNSFRFYSQNRRKANIHSETIERLLQKLSSDGLRLFARQEHIQADLMGWKKMVFKINDVLDDAMKLQATNQSVNMWLAKLPNLANDVEDLLDEFQTEASKRPGEETSQASTSHLCDSMVMPKVKEVNDRFQDIESQMVLLGLKSTNVSQRLIPTSEVSVHGLKSTNISRRLFPRLPSFHSNLGLKSTNVRRRLTPTSKVKVAIIKIALEGPKSRIKALKTVVAVSGVESAALKGDDNSQLEVRGDGMDAVKMITLLRKKVGYAELLSLSGTPYKYKWRWVVKTFNFIKRVWSSKSY